MDSAVNNNNGLLVKLNEVGAEIDSLELAIASLRVVLEPISIPMLKESENIENAGRDDNSLSDVVRQVILYIDRINNLSNNVSKLVAGVNL